MKELSIIEPLTTRLNEALAQFRKAESEFAEVNKAIAEYISAHSELRTIVVRHDGLELALRDNPRLRELRRDCVLALHRRNKCLQDWSALKTAA